MSNNRSNVAYLYENGSSETSHAAFSATPVVGEGQVADFLGKPFRAVVEIRGQVQSPGEYPYRKNSTPLEYLQEAGGPTSQTAGGNVVIIREENHRKRSLMFELSHGREAPEVMNGDILVFHNVVAENVSGGDCPSGEERRGNATFQQQHLLAHVLKPAFKRLLGQIVAAQTQANSKSLAVISCFPQEGRSLVCSMVALGLAELLNARVLVLDGSKASLGEDANVAANFVAAIPKGPGVKSAGYVDYLKLDAVGNGKFETTDFQVGRYLESMKKRYDMLLLDVAAIEEQLPCGMDPLVIAAQADAALLVLSPRALKKNHLQELRGKLGSAQVRVLGCVYNEGLLEGRG